MKNNCFFKKNIDQPAPFLSCQKRFIIKLPSGSKVLSNFKTKRNQPLSKSIKLRGTTRQLKINNLNTTRNISLNNISTRNDLLNNTISLTGNFLSPRNYNLSKLKKYRLRKSTVFDQPQNQQKQNHCKRHQFCRIRLFLSNQPFYEDRNSQNSSQKCQVLQFNIKISSTSNFLQILNDKIKNKNKKLSIIAFKTQPKNILLDLFLTFDQCDISYLNGTSLNLTAIQKINCPRIDINCFQIIKCIGSGGFSKVFLCRFKEDGKFYALKLIDKKFILKHKKTKIVMNQRNIMQAVDHPFVIKMKFAFQTANNLAFALEYCPGNEMFSLIKKYKRFTQQMARFYMIQILLGLQYLHKEGVIYRDFKPQNILLDLDGHVKIADFGLAKPNYFSLKDRAYSFCGSPQYMPPEMILKQGHSISVDFYCLGAVLYEFVTGLPPFYSKNTEQIYESTVNQEIDFPLKNKLSSQLKNLLKGLLCKDQYRRLGSLYGVSQILAHPWFGKFSRQMYLKKQVKPPTNFSSINSINIQPEQFLHKNQVFVLEAKRQQEYEKRSFKILLGGFYYDYRFSTYETNKEEYLKPMISEIGFQRKKSLNKLLNINSQRNSCNVLKKLTNNKLSLHRIETRETDHQSQKQIKRIVENA